MTRTGRTRALLQILAYHPEGLTTSQLAQAISQPSPPGPRALNQCGIAMRLHERLGRAVRTGTAPTGHRAVIWDITPDGAAWLAYQALNRLRATQDAQEAKTCARDLRVAADRMVQFRHGQPRHAADSPPARTGPRSAGAPLPAGQWTAAGLAAELRMPPATLYGWIYKHWVDATFKDRWVIHADTAELARLRKLRDQHQPGARGQAGG